jgi:SAM-dependent methyltransferase
MIFDNSENFNINFNRNFRVAESEMRVRGFEEIFEERYTEAASHPKDYKDCECEFASKHIKSINPKDILDIGSYRLYIIGLLAYYNISTIDVRERSQTLENEVSHTCDAKRLMLPNNSFDMVVSLNSIEHFGLGRYGDTFDGDADVKAVHEMIRVLKIGGYLLFTTTITQGAPSIAFNAHRIYNYKMIKYFCRNLDPVEEKFYSHFEGKYLENIANITTKPREWDVYLGCWRKMKEV